jgi:hypothetical protein
MKNIKYNFFNRYIATSLILLLSVSISCDDDDDHMELDIVNPYVVAYNPVTGVGGVDLSSNLVLVFDDIIEKGEGFITITSDTELATQVIDVNSDKVEISNVGRILTINPQDFLSGRSYKVTVDQGIVKDQTGNLFFGMPNNEEWVFTSGGNPGDIESPELVSTMPTNGSTDGTTISISLTFNEDVKVAAGNIDIYTSSDVVVASIDAEGEQVLIDGATISVLLNDPLDFGQGYYVKIASGVIKDIGGNAFPGLSDDTSWSFTTVSGSGSDLIVHLPLDSDLSDISGNNFGASLGATASVDVEFVTDAERGQVVHFAAGSYASLPKHDLLRPSATQDFSVNFWVKHVAIGSDPALMGNSDWGGGSNPGWVLAVDGANEYVPSDPANTKNGWTINLANGSERTDWEAGLATTKAPNLGDNTWHMVTMVIDQVNKQLRVYADGTEYVHAGGSDLNTLLDGVMYDETNDFSFNLWEDGSGVYNAGSGTRSQLDGFMDEVKYFNKALTPDEITALLAL